MQINQYETVCILTPSLSDDQAGHLVSNVIQLIEKEGGSLVHKTTPTHQRLAYPINKQDEGKYVVIEFKAPGSSIAKLETAYRRNEQVMRFLTTKLDKHAVVYNQNQRDNAIETKQAQVEDTTNTKEDVT